MIGVIYYRRSELARFYYETKLDYIMGCWPKINMYDLESLQFVRAYICNCIISGQRLLSVKYCDS